MKILIKIILFAIFILIGIIIIFGILYNKPNPKPISILINQSGQTRKNCTVNPVTCTSDLDCVDDCLEASEGLKMVCTKIIRNTEEQREKYGSTTNICADASATMECNNDLGGILVYSGSAGLERMEWDCICSYPEYAGSDGCQTINADVCGGPSNKDGFKWTINTGAPSDANCDCPEGKTRFRKTDGDKPICVPSSLVNWYSDLDTNDTFNKPCKNADKVIDNGSPGSCPSTLDDGQICEPTCNDGYILTGNRKCNNGVLSDTAICKSLDCDLTKSSKIMNIPNILTTGNCFPIMRDGDKCTPQCNQGYHLNFPRAVFECRRGDIIDLGLLCLEN
jgi:hypothetical protein